MTRYEAKFYGEDNRDYWLCLTNITEVRYRDNLVEFTIRPTTAQAETAVVNMDKSMLFTMTKMED